jgi:hypothetical protein
VPKTLAVVLAIAALAAFGTLFASAAIRAFRRFVKGFWPH